MSSRMNWRSDKVCSGPDRSVMTGGEIRRRAAVTRRAKPLSSERRTRHASCSIGLMSMTAPGFVDGLAASDVQAVFAAATLRRFPARRLIYDQGSPASDFFLLSKGRARYFSMTPDGRKTL